MNRRLFKKVMLFLSLSLFLISIAVIETPVSGVSWYDSSWTRRAPVTIVNTTPNILVDYQVKINVPYGSGMKADFSDLRFTSNDGATLLKYWVESYIASTSAEVWVKVPSIPEMGSTTIYMYYGNPAATSESNIKETFIFGDDFNDGSLDTTMWIEGVGAYDYPYTPLPGGGVSEADGELYIRTELQDWQWWVQNRYIVSTSSFSTRGTAFDYKVRIILYTPQHPQHLNGLFILDRRLAPEPDGMLDPPPEFGYNLLSMGMMGSQESQWLPSIWGLPYYGDTLLGVKDVNYGAYNIICDEPWTYGEGYALLSIRLTDSEMAFVANGAEVYRGVNDFANFVESGYIYACAGGRGYYGPPFLSETWFDDIRVRKYVEPEPTASIGVEEVWYYLSLGMISYWKFDEGVGTTAFDSVGPNDGRIYGASWTTGKVGRALSFDGIDDYVLVPDSPSLCPTDEITVEAWIMPYEMEWWFSKHIVTKADSDYYDYNIPYSSYDLFIRNYPSGSYNVEFGAYFEGSGHRGYRTETGPLTIYQWNHVVGTYNGSYVKIYVNGNKVLEQPQTGKIIQNWLPNMTLQIGAAISTRSGVPSVCHFNGRIDEVAIYSRALTGKEILNHYEKGLQGLSYYKFPYIKSFSVNPTPFSPNGDGRKDTTIISASFNSSVNWQLQVRTPEDTIVRVWTGTSRTLTVNWDGKDGEGNTLPEGDYKLHLSGANLANKPFVTKWKWVTIDTRLPTVNVTVYQPPFDPEIGQTTTINYGLSETCYMTIKIYSANTLYRTLLNNALENAGSHCAVWDGRDNAGAIVPQGTYTIKIWVVDKAGNTATTYPMALTVIVQ